MRKTLIKLLEITVLAICIALCGCTKELFRASEIDSICVNALVGNSAKGGEITTSNLMAFKMDAVIGDDSGLEPANMVYFRGATVSRSAVGQPWVMAPEYKWVGEKDIHFWSYAPAVPNGTLSITSESPAGAETKLGFDFRTTTSASSQEDLIFAYNCERRDFDEDKEHITGGTTTDASQPGIENTNQVNVKFYHALSEISFAVSTDDGTFDTDLKIDEITLENVSRSGSCVFTGPLKDAGFVWTPSATDCADFSATGLGTNSFEDIAVSGDANWQAGSYGSPSKTLLTTKNLFFVIPQDHSSDVQGLPDAFITILFHRISTGNTDRLKVKIEDKWKPGEYYKYKIKATTAATMILLDCELCVEDWVDGSGSISL